MTLDQKALKRGLDDLRAHASRGPVSSREIFILTDPLMDMIARAEAAPSGQAPLVEVKPLEFSKSTGWPKVAETPFGVSYRIWAGKDVWFGDEWLHSKHASSEGEAVEWAQADYEARVRSSLLAPASAETAEGWWSDYKTYECAPVSPPANAEPVAWCQPMKNGEHTPRQFLVYYEDADMGIATFDNEADARAHWERAKDNWNCYLFGALPLASPPASAEPVAWISQEMLAALKEGRWGRVWPNGGTERPIPLYASAAITEELVERALQQYRATAHEDRGLEGFDERKAMRAALEAASPPASGAVEAIASERRRQIEAEGWTPEHDDKHQRGEMASAAACYATSHVNYEPDGTPLPIWPWEREWWKPTNRRRDLVKAGALIVAEIERLDRLPASPAGEG